MCANTSTGAALQAFVTCEARRMAFSVFRDIALRNQYRPIVVHVGACRTGDNEIAKGGKKTLGIIILHVLLRQEVERACACQRIGREIGAGVILRSIDAVGIAGQCRHPLRTIQFQRERQ